MFRCVARKPKDSTPETPNVNLPRRSIALSLLFIFIFIFIFGFCYSPFCETVYDQPANGIDMTWTYKQILEKNKDIWLLLYNGDSDAICNFLGTEWFADDLMGGMKETIVKKWRTWSVGNETLSPIGGFTKDWERLSFVTIRGAGHAVPSEKPEEMLRIVDHFLRHEML